jgi:hypothetical protein
MRLAKRIVAAGIFSAVSAHGALAQPVPGSIPAEGALPASDPLHQVIAALDRRLFDAFNSCAIPAMRDLMEPGLEFYQDNDDSTFSRDQLEASQRLRCQGGTSRISRELSAIAVYPLKGYGALEVGRHRFYEMQEGKRGRLDSEPYFLHVWRNDQGKWTLARVISYGH